MFVLKNCSTIFILGHCGLKCTKNCTLVSGSQLFTQLPLTVMLNKVDSLFSSMLKLKVCIYTFNQKVQGV